MSRADDPDANSSGPKNGESERRVGWLSRIALIGRDEWPAAALSFVYFFFLLFSYYILRPVRDEMGVRGGIDNMHWLFTATFIAMLFMVPLFASLAARLRRSTLMPSVYGIFIACIGGFWFWLESGIAMDWAARAFFVWLSVFNLFVISVFWSFMADIFDSEQATRLFGFIAAGGSMGAILGPGLTGFLAQTLPPRDLLLIAGGALLCTLPCIWALQYWQTQGAASSRSVAQNTQALGGTLLEGFRAIASSRYLMGICVFIWLYTTLSTFLYFAQADIVESTFSDSGDRTSVFAALDFATNTLTVLLQLFLTARLVQKLGLQRALAAVPLLVAGGFACLALAPVITVLFGFQLVRRAGNYAITKPGREMLFTVLPRMEKYKAKNIIDTLVYRGGDAIAGWMFAGLTALGLSLMSIAWLSVPVALIWALIGYGLGKERIKRVRQADSALSGKKQEDIRYEHSESTPAP
ncbi:MFS transporter [Marinobacter sp. BGYM27]|uniref:NTP/NDP exchange transporter n=1 Tax=Marinobacter sp. BGYM27 TaxID=2975597 RepID=UPI0021A27B87|nr:MFS transporter [Marinobacter sp. BGYM27]MDG5500253.1 MFS transporter [Marinobacter sp. BGYM27]